MNRRTNRKLGQGMEPLECRRLMAADVQLSGNVLKIVGTDAAETITIENKLVGNEITPTKTGSKMHFAVSITNSTGALVKSFSVEASKVAGVFALGKGGDDTIINLTNRPGVVYSIYGGAGNDTLLGTAGDEALFGEAGDDTIIAGAGNDYLDGGSDDDLLQGEAGDDTLRGGVGSDLLQAGDGNDALFGESGDDKLRGGAGNDHLQGGDHMDEIYGELGNDLIYGGLGIDHLFGGDGNDWIEADEGNDFLYGGAGNDMLIGGEGADEMHGDSGDDTLRGGFGNDTIWGGFGTDDLSGGDGNDFLVGGAQYSLDIPNSDSDLARDILHGDAGADHFEIDKATRYLGVGLLKKRVEYNRDVAVDFDTKEGDRVANYI